MPRIAEIEAKKPGADARAARRRRARVGLLGHDVPEAYGGLGGDKTSSSLITEAASRQGSFAVSFGAHVGIGTMPLVLFGTAEQRQKYLPRLATGEMIAAYALTEPGSGSDALAAKTKAVKSADGKSWKLTGTKHYITNAGFADLFTVFAKVDGEKFTAFLVERERARADHRARGAQARHPRQLDLPAVSRGLHDPDRQRARDDRAGPQDRLQHPQHRALEAGRRRGGRRQVLPGAGREVRARAQAVRQADRRVRSDPQEDRRHRDADLRRRVDGLPHRRACSTRARKAIDPADPQAQKKQIDAIEEHAIEASIIKVFGSEMLHATADETLQIFGGAGYIEDYPIERVSRDARINRIFEGTNEINRLLVPGTLLKRALTGRLALMGLVGEVQQELADPIKIDRRVPDGPLGRERKKCDFAKRAIAYGASLGVQKYMQAISEKQELLGVLADCLILTFGMDSAISRTLQLIAAKGEAASQIPICMTQLFVAKAHEQVFDMLREMLMWMSQDEEWGREIRDINSYYNLDRVNTFSLRRKIAQHVIEAGGYAL